MHSAREATPADLPAIAALFESARLELGTARGGDLLLAREMATLDPAALIDDPDAYVVVGTYDGVVVGIATARLETLADGSCLAVIGSLYVDREAREVGVGEAMLDQIFPWATEHGCRGIDALVLPGMRESKNFFEMFGLVARDRRAPATVKPEVCVGAVVVDDGALLLVRRGRGAAPGRWSIPGGRVEYGETLAEAVLRELEEETGLEGVCGPCLGWVERIIAEGHFVIFDFEVVVLDNTTARAGDDASEVAWVPLDDLIGRRDLVDGLLEFLQDVGVVDALT